MNKFDLVDGTLPDSAQKQIAISASFANANDIEVGDTYQLYEVTGLIKLPNFLYPILSYNELNIDYNTQVIILMPFNDFNNQNFGFGCFIGD